MHGCKDEVECGSTLKLACTDNSPKAFGSFSSRFTSCPLSDMTVNDNETNRLFSYVVGGLHAGCRNEGKVGFSMFPKTTGHILGMSF